MTLKTKYTTSNFEPQKEKILTKVKDITELNLNKKQNLNKYNQY